MVHEHVPKDSRIVAHREKDQNGVEVVRRYAHTYCADCGAIL